MEWEDAHFETNSEIRAAPLLMPSSSFFAARIVKMGFKIPSNTHCLLFPDPLLSPFTPQCDKTSACAIDFQSSNFIANPDATLLTKPSPSMPWRRLLLLLMSLSSSIPPSQRVDLFTSSKSASTSAFAAVAFSEESTTVLTVAITRDVSSLSPALECTMQDANTLAAGETPPSLPLLQDTKAEFNCACMAMVLCINFDTIASVDAKSPMAGEYKNPVAEEGIFTSSNRRRCAASRPSICGTSADLACFLDAVSIRCLRPDTTFSRLFLLTRL
mmetsp:Transcript_10780/g.12737  ORF Transcript_10780/g.12737 Transcript_10780/m.12737 type:complete len:272 (-) Transcript_10780:588-1403(-)